MKLFCRACGSLMEQDYTSIEPTYNKFTGKLEKEIIVRQYKCPKFGGDSISLINPHSFYTTRQELGKDEVLE